MNFSDMDQLSTTGLLNASDCADDGCHGLSNRSILPTAEDPENSLFLDQNIFDRPAVRITFVFMYTVVFCLCFFGNLTVVLVVTLHWRMRNITKFCMGNLAFANLCVGIFCIYQNLSTFLTDTWVFGWLLCKMYHFINSLSHTASILILVVICIERYLAILHPFKFRQIVTMARLRVTIVGVWLISAVICSPRLFFFTTYYIPLEGGTKYDVICAPQRTLYNSHAADMVYFVLLFALPLIIISILYARVGLVIWQGSSMIRSIGGLDTSVPGNHHDIVPNNSRCSDFSSALGNSSASGTSDPCTPRCSSKFPFPFHNRLRRLSRRYLRWKRRKQCRFKSPMDTPSRRSSPLNDDRVEMTQVQVFLETEKKGRGTLETTSLIFQSEVTAGKGVKNGGDIVWNDREQEERHCSVTAGRRCSPKPRRLLKTKYGVDVLLRRVARDPSLRSKAGESPFRPEEFRKGDVAPHLNSRGMGGGAPWQSGASELHHVGPPSRITERLIQLADARRKKLLKTRQAVIRVLIAIVVSFAVCNLPFHLRKICQYYVPSYDFGSDFSYLITPLTFLLMYTNCAINPILYAFLSKSFRSSLQDVFKLKVRKLPVHITSARIH